MPAVDLDACHAWLAAGRHRTVGLAHPRRAAVVALVAAGRARWTGLVGSRTPTRAVAVRDCLRDTSSKGLVADLLAECPTTCAGCGRVAYVTVGERLARRWDCYRCGRVNVWTSAGPRA